mgnify:CR=1 FL=1
MSVFFYQFGSLSECACAFFNVLVGLEILIRLDCSARLPAPLVFQRPEAKGRTGEGQSRLTEIGWLKHLASF